MLKNEQSIIDAFDDVFGKYFKPRDSWQNWRTFLKVVYGIPLEEEEKALVFECTGRKRFPENGFDEFYAIVGRRGGKSRIMSLIATYEAMFGDWHEHLSPGETAQIFIIANDKKQARIVLNYTKALLSKYVDFGGEILEDSKEKITLDNGVEILVQAATFRGTRGFSTAVVILDELAFFRTEDSANPAEEIVNALLPSLLPRGKLIGISTPYSKFGYLYDTFKQYYEKEDEEILVWRAPTLTMNPKYKERLIRRARKKDPIAARSEYDAEFREDISSYLAEEELRACIEEGVFQRAPQFGRRYFAFVDVSGARKDSFTYAIAHEEYPKKKVMLDVIHEVTPPFVVQDEIRSCCEVMKDYGIHQVIGDKYGGELPAQMFRENGIKYLSSELTKNDLFLEFSTLVRIGRVSLLDNKKMKMQLLMLERKTAKSGRDSVEHLAGLHDDIANSVAGACVAVAKRALFHPSAEELASRRPVRISHKVGSRYNRDWRGILDPLRSQFEKIQARNREIKERAEVRRRESERERHRREQEEKRVRDEVMRKDPYKAIELGPGFETVIMDEEKEKKWLEKRKKKKKG